MLTMFIKTYCVNVVVDIKPILLNKQVFSVSLYNYKRKLFIEKKSFIAKKMFVESEIKKRLGGKKSIF